MKRIIDEHDQDSQTAAAKQPVWVLVTVTTAGLEINGQQVPAAWTGQHSTVFVKKMLDQVIVMANLENILHSHFLEI